MYTVVMCFDNEQRTITVHDKLKAETMFDKYRAVPTCLFAALYGPTGLTAMTDARPPANSRTVIE